MNMNQKMQPETGADPVLYFDNAATSWPKPAEMIEAMIRYNAMIGGNPGRSGHHRSLDAGRIILETREALAELFGCDAFRIVFTQNATEALNICLSGLLQAGDHVITSSMEHNSVMRPLRFLESQGVELSVIPCSGDGLLDPDDVRTAIRPQTRLVVVTHASNVTGTIQPLVELGRITRDHGIVFCVDAAQTAGALSIDVDGHGDRPFGFLGSQVPLRTSRDRGTVHPGGAGKADPAFAEGRHGESLGV